MNDMREIELVLKKHQRPGDVIRKGLEGIQDEIEIILDAFDYEPIIVNDLDHLGSSVLFIDKRFFKKSIVTNVSVGNEIIKQLMEVSNRTTKNCLIIIKKI